MENELEETEASEQEPVKVRLFVWKRASWTRRDGQYSWRVNTVKEAKDMIVYWRSLEPSFYHMGGQWVVTRGENYDDVVAEFTTGEAVRGE